MSYQVPKVIKRVTGSDLLALTETAVALHLGAGRSVAWMAAHVASSADGALWAILRESSPRLSYRCLIVVQRVGGATENLSLDLLPEDFDRFPDLVGEPLMQLARWALSYVPISPMPAQ